MDMQLAGQLHDAIKSKTHLLLTGEGSSRLFPAKNCVFRWLQSEGGPFPVTESANDLAGMDMDRFVVIGASNSGRTKELVDLFTTLHQSGHTALFGLTCNQDHLLTGCTHQTILLQTGKEHAVAATKSVMAQALFYDLLFSKWKGLTIDTDLLAQHVEQALHTELDKELVARFAGADHIYFVGLNNGVAEELALKANETIRKRTAYLPGSYLLHGVEEVVTRNDVVVMIDYFPAHAEKIRDIFVESIGATVVAFSGHQTPFHTIRLPVTDQVSLPYVKLAAGWICLLQTGLYLGVDLDKPERVRKIGNEFHA